VPDIIRHSLILAAKWSAQSASYRSEIASAGG